MTPTAAQLAEWLDSLAEDSLQEGDPGMAATGVASPCSRRRQTVDPPPAATASQLGRDRTWRSR